MLEDDAERVDWGHDEDEQQVLPASDAAYSQRQTMGGYAGEDAEDAVSLGGDDEDEREFYAQHSAEQVSIVGSNILLSKTSTISHTHSTSNRRDSQRQSATSSQRARTPSQPQNSESPDGHLRRTHSASALAPTPMMHALPPKPAVVPPPYRPPSPVRPGILASAMSYRQKKSNGSGKSSVAPDGGDPLPPDWEIRYPRNGGKDVYYFNVKTEESTWVRPRLPPSGKSSPVKDRESASGRLSPDLEAAWSDRSGRGQGPRTQRRDNSARIPSPPPPAEGSLTYQDRHYRPGDAAGAAPKAEIVDRRDERSGTKSTYVSESSHGRTRTPSPQASDRRWRPRSVSPSRERLPRRELTPPPRGDMRDASRDFDRQTDVGWGRSQRQEPVDGIQVAPRSPSGRRVRRKDDVEPPLRRRKDDIEPPLRRKDDIEPPIRRKDDIEPWTRRKDDIEPPLRRKDDFEPPLRRKDDIEPPLRPLPRKQPSARHEIDEWSASRPPLREPSPPRRFAPSTYPSSEDLLTHASNSAREPSRYERSHSPPRYPPRDLPPSLSTDTLPQRRARDGDDGYDNSKKRRLNNDEPGPSRRPPHDVLPPPVTLPPKPSFPLNGPADDAAHRRRAPLPPQDQQWRENKKGGPSGPPPAAYGPMAAPGPAGPGARYPPPLANEPERRPHVYADDRVADNREDRFRAPPDAPAVRRHGRSPPRDIDVGRSSRPPPNGPSERTSRFEQSVPPPNDRMDVDVLPSPSRMNSGIRSVTGGMHADRMQAEPPRRPRAMAPRDGPMGGYPPGPPGPPGPQGPFNGPVPAAPLLEPPASGPGRGRGRLPHPMADRRWEPNDSGRRPNYPGPPPAEPLDPPPRRSDTGTGVPRDFPDRSLRGPDRHDERGPPSRVSGTNNIPIGSRPSGYASDHSASNVAPSPVDRFRPANDYGDLPPRPPMGGPEPFDRRRQPGPPSDLLTPGPPRGDRGSRRPSVGHDDAIRPRGAEPMIEPPAHSLPPRPRDGANSRQSRFGPNVPPPNAPPDDQPRIWQTRDEAQSARPQDHAPDVRTMRDDLPPPRESNGWHAPPQGPPPGRWPAGDSYRPGGPDIPGPRTRSPEVPPRYRPPTPPPVDEARRFDGPLVEHPVAGRVHPERARLLGPPPEEFDRIRQERRRHRGISSPTFGPPMERSPPPSQNGHRPDIKRGGSLLERLTLHDGAPHDNGGSSLRDRADGPPPRDHDDAAGGPAETMEVDAEGGQGDDGQKNGGGRGPGRRRPGKPRRSRRN